MLELVLATIICLNEAKEWRDKRWEAVSVVCESVAVKADHTDLFIVVSAPLCLLREAIV